MRRLDRRQLHAALLEARRTTLALLDDLEPAQWTVPQLPIINPPRWELGHVGWFMERWCLRLDAEGHASGPALLADADRWYDSGRVPHATRWSLDLPSLGATRAYLEAVLERTLARLASADDSDAGLYYFRLALYHEDMHGEAFTYTRQTLGYAAPATLHPAAAIGDGGDVAVAGGCCMQGAPRGAGFVFDNEKWQHEVDLAPYAIARAPVSNAQFARFVEAGGYREPRWWTPAGWDWRLAQELAAPLGWRCDGSGWQQRVFDRWLPLDPALPVRHVSAHEAEAWCRWAGRRLPSEAEWEQAALQGAIAPAGVWEWTATPFLPYPGFTPDPYEDYSRPWFESHRCVRGASIATPRRLWHPRFRNFYLPERNDIFVGFRTCAL